MPPLCETFKLFCIFDRESIFLKDSSFILNPWFPDFPETLVVSLPPRPWYDPTLCVNEGDVATDRPLPREHGMHHVLSVIWSVSTDYPVGHSNFHWRLPLPCCSLLPVTPLLDSGH